MKTVARYFQWPPQQLGELYLDDFDFMGLIYWYNDARDQEKEINKLKKK